MRIYVWIGVLFFQVTIAFSQDSLNITPINEYRYKGGGLVCFTDSISPLACLHIGSIRIGDEYAGIEAKYGSVSQKIPQSEGREVRVFELQSKTKQTTYLAITVKNNLIDAIQVAGASPEESLSFSSINIGDSPQWLIQLLGKPSKSKLVEETGATLWSYAPFPFSFEIVGEEVYSIKIWNP